MYSSYAVAIVVCSVIFPTLAAMAVFLRFYARRMKALDLRADDWAITGALVSARRIFHWRTSLTILEVPFHQSLPTFTLFCMQSRVRRGSILDVTSAISPLPRGALPEKLGVVNTLTSRLSTFTQT